MISHIVFTNICRDSTIISQDESIVIRITFESINLLQEFLEGIVDY